MYIDMSNKLNVYLAGKISGNDNYKEDFDNAIKKLSIHKNLNIINPLDNGLGNNPQDWVPAMKADIKKLVDCDILVDIENGTENSRGVMLEKMIAVSLDIKIVRLSDFLAQLAMQTAFIERI